MNIEQAIDILENSIADYVIGEYCEKCADNKICDDRNEDCYYQQAIDIVVTAYEKEKEANKKLDKEAQGYLEELAGDGSMNIRRIQELEAELEKEKEKNNKIDEFCRKELAFERRLKRENIEPDEFNQGRFYVSENIRKIIKEE
jgi:hypothetical protein